MIEPTPDARISSVELRSGQKFTIEEGVTVIVGPNNAGKSAFLRDIVSFLGKQPYDEPTPGTVINGVQVDWMRSSESQIEHLKSTARYHHIGTPAAMLGTSDFVFDLPNGLTVTGSYLMDLMNRSTSFGSIVSNYVLHFSAENRTGLVGPDPSYDTVNGFPATPLQSMWADHNLEAKLSMAVKESFGKGITVNRYGGNLIHLHYGQTAAKETSPPLSEEYKAQLRKLPLVNAQGDGMRSFIGLVLSMLAGNHQLVLIDEPEAFLHPPQARNLGRLLVKLCQTGSQIIVATHSDDIVQGIASSGGNTTNVAIHRITRSGDENHVASIPTDAVRNLYADPFMRYSSVMEGLFYHGVAVCESFGDCTYYRSVLDSLPRNSPHVDIHFTQTGGKQRIASAVRSLRSAAVPVASIVDIDILSDKKELATLVDAHGGEPLLFDRRLNVIQSQVALNREPVLRERLQSKVGPLLEIDAKELTRNEISTVREAIQGRSGWKLMKASGVALLKGEALLAIESVIDDLGELGIFVVPVGELESFHPRVGSKEKMAWLKQVMDQRLHESEGAHRVFIEKVQAYIAAGQLTPPEPAIP